MRWPGPYAQHTDILAAPGIWLAEIRRSEGHHCLEAPPEPMQTSAWHQQSSPSWAR